MKSCPYCGATVEEGAAVCAACNTPLPSHSTPTRLSRPGEAPLEAGRVLGNRYEVLSCIGQGGMGFIYRVRDRVLNEEVVLKTLRPSLANDPEIVERFFNEARVARKLTHDNIIRVHDIGSTEGVVYISMEYLEGVTLRDHLKSLPPPGRLPLMDALLITHDLCRALEYAHQITVHRDIKPENIMLTRDGHVKLMDFGISKLVNSPQVTQVAAVMGTPFYMSPEQLRDSHDVDGRADIFSVGVILYEMLTGNRPTGIPKPASEIAKVPPLIDEIIAKCVDEDRNRRYPTARALRETIKPIILALREGKDLSTLSTPKPGAAHATPAAQAAPSAPAVSIPSPSPAKPVKSDPAAAAKPPAQPAQPQETKQPSFPQLDPKLRELSLMHLELPDPAHQKKKKRTSTLPAFLKYGAIALAACVLLYFGGNFAVAKIREMRNRQNQVVTVPNRALDMLARGDSPLQALDEALRAVRESNSPENQQILQQVRQRTIEEIQKRLNCIPYDPAKIAEASEMAMRFVEKDACAESQAILQRVNEDLSNYKFVLAEVDTATGKARFLLNNPGRSEREQIVSEGELLQDRFLIKKVGSNYVLLDDTRVGSEQTGFRALRCRLMSPVTAL